MNGRGEENEYSLQSIIGRLWKRDYKYFSTPKLGIFAKKRRGSSEVMNPELCCLKSAYSATVELWRFPQGPISWCHVPGQLLLTDI